MSVSVCWHFKGQKMFLIRMASVSNLNHRCSMLCRIIVSNFENIRNGDRFWYEKILSPSEIRMIHNLTLSDIIRRNSGLKNYPAPAFFSSRYCQGVKNHQCIPVDRPSCPASSSATSPPSMATTTVASQTSTSPAAPSDVPAITAMPPSLSLCCTQHAACTADLVWALGNLTIALDNSSTWQATANQLRGQLSNTSVSTGQTFTSICDTQRVMFAISLLVFQT